MSRSEQWPGAGRPAPARVLAVPFPSRGRASRWPGAAAEAVPPVQSFLFGHSRAEVVYDCR
ncbi:hypothetical protein [Actinomadura viridis]|uniref:Uncharacterized protein n=1 Tax=Actinomadura viridis TaxID=58110 RepID=A0A931DPX8_9ACTN|nr:hypothetical protein [Actinomadura viridis]MBG6093667.1 hypothetical protein [Actinomadura viridis]